MKKILLSILMVIGVSATISAQCTSMACTYSTGTTPYSLSTIGTNSVAVCDDCLSPSVPIGFNFNFMCNTYSTVKIGSNGFISFDPTITSSGCCSGGIIPSNDGVNGIVALFWTDLYNSSTNSITYGTIGTSPNRTFVVTYNAVPICCGSTFPHTGQIKLVETSNFIDVHMGNVPNSGLTLTQGIENLAGTLGYTTSVMAGTGFSANNLAYRYTPTSPLVATVPSAISGTNTLCSGSTAIYSVTSIPSATAYGWSLPGGWVGTSTTNTISITPSSTGVMSVSASYTGCGTSTATVKSVTVISSPTVSVSGATLTCGTSTNVLTASGANTYSWSTGATTSSISVSPTVTTNYVVVGTASATGCSNSYTQAVTVAPDPTISVNSGAVCSGSSFTMVASGATTYTYSSGSAVVSPTASSNYSVTGTSALGCVSSNTAISSVTVNAAPVISVNSGAICAGQSFTMVGSGAGTYTFSNGSAVATPTANASYTVTGTSTAGCVGNAAISTVTVNALPTVTASSSTSGSICAGQSVSLTANGATTYSWNTGATTAVIAVSPSVTTTYTVNGTSNGCSNVSTVTQAVNSCVGIQTNANQLSAISIYPNPSTGIFTVEFANGLNKTINVTDITGRVVLTTSSTSDKVNVNISTLSNGIYYIKVISNNKAEVIKVVKH